MFKHLRALSETAFDLSTTLQGIHRSLEGVTLGAQRTEALERRVGELEATLARTMAEAEATLITAKAEYRKAANADQRARDKLKQLESLEDDETGDAALEARIARMADGDASSGGTEGMPPMRPPLEDLSPVERVTWLKYNGY